MKTNYLTEKRIGRLRIVVPVLSFVAFQFLFAGRAEAQFLWPFNQGTVYRSRTVTHYPGQVLSLGTGNTMTTNGLSVSPYGGQTLAVSPGFTGQTLSLSSSPLALGYQPTYQLTTGTSSPLTLSVSPQATLGVGANSGLTLNVSSPVNGSGVVSLDGATTTLEQGNRYISLALGGDQTKVNGFLQNLRKQAKALVSGMGSDFTKQDLSNSLLAAAKAGLGSTGWGLLAEPLVSIFLKPVIDNIVGDVWPSGSGAPATDPVKSTPSAPQTGAVVPPGGISFTVTGTIVLTPAAGTTQQTNTQQQQQQQQQPQPKAVKPAGGQGAPAVGAPSS